MINLSYLKKEINLYKKRINDAELLSIKEMIQEEIDRRIQNDENGKYK